MRSTSARLAIAILLVAASACAGPPAATPPLPTVNEAQGFLAQVVALAQRHDFKGLCAIGDGNCERSLDDAGRDMVPPAPPAVIGVRILPTTKNGDQISIGGVILEMCGKDAAGKPYHSEMLVFRDGSSLRAINPVYWGNTKITGGDTVSAVSISPQPAC